MTEKKEIKSDRKRQEGFEGVREAMGEETGGHRGKEAGKEAKGQKIDRYKKRDRLPG